MYGNLARGSGTASGNTMFLARRVLEEAAAAADAHCLASTLVHVALATAYAERCRNAGDRAWIEENRAW